MRRRVSFEEFERGVLRLADLESVRLSPDFRRLLVEVDAMTDQQIVDRLMAQQLVYGVEV